MQILKGVREGAKAAVFQEGTDAKLDLRRVHQGLRAVMLLRDRVGFTIFGDQIRYGLRMICNLPQHIRTVKMLTSGDESNLQICELSHRIALHLVEPSRVFTSESNSGRRSPESDTC